MMHCSQVVFDIYMDIHMNHNEYSYCIRGNFRGHRGFIFASQTAQTFSLQYMYI